MVLYTYVVESVYKKILVSSDSIMLIALYSIVQDLFEFSPRRATLKTLEVNLKKNLVHGNIRQLD